MKIEICADKPTVCKITDAAIPLFAIKGMAAVSVKELADAAGVNVALISYYFGGKENLYAFILEHQLAILINSVAQISQENISPVMKLRRFAQTSAAAHKNNPYMDRLFYGEIINPTKCFDSIVKPVALKLYQFVVECIREAVGQGEFRSDLDTDLAAMALFRIIHMPFAEQHLAMRMAPVRENWVECYVSQAFDIYLRGVSAH